MSIVRDLRSEFSMADNEGFKTGYVSGQMNVIMTLLSDLKSGQLSNHKENTAKIDNIAAELFGMKHDVKANTEWISGEGKPAVEKAKRLKYWLMGSVGTTGLAVTSPQWFSKLVAIIGSHGLP